MSSNSSYVRSLLLGYCVLVDSNGSLCAYRNDYETIMIGCVQWRSMGAKGASALGGNQEGAAKIGVKRNKLEFLKLLSHMLNTDLLIFVFKENGALSILLL